MPNIYITRHGQDEDNAKDILNGRRDTPLTSIGLEQTNSLADSIKESAIQFEKIYSSPLKRAYQTAQIIAEALGHEPPPKLDLLIERDFGIMTGQPKSTIEKFCAPNILKTDTITYFLNPQGAETFPDLIERSRQIFKFIENRHQTGNILLVTHGDIGKMIYCTFYGENWRDFLPKFHFGNSDLLLISPNSHSNDSHVIKAK